MDKGYYRLLNLSAPIPKIVAIHNKNGQGLLPNGKPQQYVVLLHWSQSTIKMDKGYYYFVYVPVAADIVVAIHNKNGQGLLQK